ncbi:MAG TPA: hypothetical protein VFQ53_15715 [Kofleriaceae bacterium]|nr:hypothetical protein [Kofleriaceae bacterium]
MDKQNRTFDDEPGLDGPDYVALVIEWDEIADTIEDEITQKNQLPLAATAEPARPVSLGAMAKHALHSNVGKAIGALAALVIARWGIRRLRAA